MRRERSELRVLLMQIRRDARVRAEEHESFCRHSRLAAHQIEVLDVFDQRSFDRKAIEDYDALLVGGSSTASVLEPHRFDFLPKGQAMMRACLEQDIPVFASCFGFQMAVLELGGQVTRDAENFEMGTLPIAVTPHAEGDPVFGSGPRSMLAVSVHQESAIECPPGCVELARTDLCCHSFRVVDRRFWAFQFHPELDLACLQERLTIYKDGYTEDDGHLDSVLAGLRETPESNQLVSSFVDNVLLRQ